MQPSASANGSASATVLPPSPSSASSTLLSPENRYLQERQRPELLPRGPERSVGGSLSRWLSLKRRSRDKAAERPQDQEASTNVKIGKIVLLAETEKKGGCCGPTTCCSAPTRRWRRVSKKNADPSAASSVMALVSPPTDRRRRRSLARRSSRSRSQTPSPLSSPRRSGAHAQSPNDRKLFRSPSIDSVPYCRN